MADEPLGVTITSREIYDEIVGMREDVRSLTQHHESVTTKLTDHEDRLRALERWKYALPTAAVTAVVSAVVSVAKVSGKG